MKAADLRSKSTEELNKELLALLKEKFNLCMQKGAGQEVKTNLLKKARLGIARIKTVLQEKGYKV
ncbi:MAG TPA: 50S ribosomal protein L29 [Gammaproteobacteria bacterium]|jgi:large subunit ribosomal protein L29|nr:50S ribosomal protein L29 [Gammaproteobacteria bacterium]